MMIGRFERLAVIGAGTMGSGIALVAALAGHATVLVDGQESALQRSRDSIEQMLASQAKRGRITAEDAVHARQRISWTTDLGTAASAALAIEAIIEDQDAKAALFTRLESVLDEQAVIASNTSSFSIARLASRMQRPERFVGLHFFNPVAAMQLVEVIGSGRNEPALLEALVDMIAAWGKQPVRVRDVPGFIVNRVARPYYAEGFAAAGEGIDPAMIDSLMEHAGGFRMGPLALSDMIGHDVNYSVACSVHAAYDGRTRFRPSPIQAQLVAQGALGRKSGRGFYAYGEGEPGYQPIRMHEAGATGEALPLRYQQGAAFRPLIGRLQLAGSSAIEDPALPEGCLAFGPWQIGMGDGRTLDDRPELDALLDHQRNPDTATAMAVTARSDEVFAAIAALLAQAGIVTIAVPDRPGQVVLRSLAQLANAAFDALVDDVADAAGINAAMRLGANHPEGPLQWAARFGPERLAAVLANIAQASGDAIYLPSPAITRGAKEQIDG